jgi:hypothetical protein
MVNRGNLNQNSNLFSKKDEMKPAILIAADFKYFGPVLDALKLIKANFYEFEIVIYDLGIHSSYMIKEVNFHWLTFPFDEILNYR